MEVFISTVTPARPSPGTSAPPDPDGSAELIACIVCDALHHVPPDPLVIQIKCVRCGSTLLRPPQPALDHILGSAVATVILVISALFFPFLQISASGLKSSTTLIETALAFNRGLTSPLSFALIIVIIVLPVARAVLLSYAVLPLRFGWKIPDHAGTAFHIANFLRPWAMVEVFIVGVVVALVKIGGLASVGLGPAFWELLLILLIVILESSSLCEKTVWRMMQKRRRP